ncbi:unnamed protein product, partial [Scytosiphon promiscuus]
MQNVHFQYPAVLNFSRSAIVVRQGMGFDRPAVLQALQQTGNDSYAAVNLLIA